MPSTRSAPRRPRRRAAVTRPATTTGTRPTSTHSQAPAAPSVQASPPAGARTSPASARGDDDGSDGDDRQHAVRQRNLSSRRPSSSSGAPPVHHADHAVAMEVFHHRDDVRSWWGGYTWCVVTRMDSRRVFVLGVAGLVPAALVTLLLVHQPSIGARRLYPMLRGSAHGGRPHAGAGDADHVGDGIQPAQPARRSADWPGRA